MLARFPPSELGEELTFRLLVCASNLEMSERQQRDMHVESEAGKIGEMENAAEEAVAEVLVEFGRRRSERRGCRNSNDQKFAMIEVGKF
jgi:hypothetical protein